MGVPVVTSGWTMLADFDNSGTGSDSITFGTGTMSGSPTGMVAGAGLTINASGTFNDVGVNDSGCIGVRTSFGTFSEGDTRGRYFNLSADLTGEIIGIHTLFSTAEVYPATQSDGIAFGLVSGNNAANCAWWVLGGSNSAIPEWGCSIIDPTKSDTASEHTGTFDPSDVTQIIMGIHANIALKNYFFDSFGTIGNYIITDGDSGTPGDFSAIVDQFDTDDVNLVSSFSDLAYLLFFSPQIGDGTTATYYRDSLRILEFTKESDFTAGSEYGRAHINAGALGFYIDASATCDIEIDQYVLLGSLAWVCDLKAASGANVQLNNFVFDNASAFTLEDGINLNGCTISNCPEIQATAPSMSGGAISNGAGIKVTDTANISGVTFSNNSKALIVDVAGNASITLDANTFSGNTIDIEYTGAGTLTVTNANGSNPDAGKESTPGGGSIVYAGGGATLTLTGLVADSEVRIYETGTSTELAGIESSTASFAYAYSSAQDVDIVIHKEDYKYIRIDAYTLGASDAAIPIQQIFDRNYSNPA